MNKKLQSKRLQAIGGESGCILLLSMGIYLVGEYGRWGNISWEGIFGLIITLIGFFGYMLFAIIKDVNQKRGGVEDE